MRLALQFLKADLSNGDLRLLLAALLLSISLVGALSSFVERLELMLVGESSQFLAADRVLSSPDPIDALWQEKAREAQLLQAQFLSFQSMLYVADQPLLVSVKAASDGYPLKGELHYRDTLYGTTLKTAVGPSAGEVWLEARALQSLNIAIGSEVFIGEAALLVTKELVSEPDRGFSAFSLGPRALMHLSDVPRTEVVQLGSRLNYRYLFAGTEAALVDFHQWLKPQLGESQKWLDLKDSQPSIALSLQRAKNFFFLASAVVVVLASLAVAMASIRYANQHTQHVAVLKTLGAKARDIQRLFLFLLLLIYVFVLVVGLGLAYGLQEALVSYVAASKQLLAPPVSYRGFVLAAGIAALSLLSFSLPYFAGLKNVSAMQIFRLQGSAALSITFKAVIGAFAGLLVMLYLYTNDIVMSLILLSALAVMIVLVFWPSRLLLQVLHRRLSPHLSPSQPLSFALNTIQRGLQQNAFLVAIFVVSLAFLLLLLGIRDSLFSEWAEQLPAKAPNFFLVNIAQDQQQAVHDWLLAEGIAVEENYPMIRGRLIEINAQAVRENVSKEDLKRAGVDRELNLSWSETLPSSNSLEAGAWWPELSASAELPWVSVESKLAEKLAIKVGDVLTFQIAAERLQAKVANTRKVNWNSMQPNFYMLFQTATLQPYARTYMTSFYLPETEQIKTVRLLQLWPALVLLDVNAIINQVRSIVSQVSQALQLVLAFVLLSSILVLIANIQSSLDQRMQDNAIIRALGGSHSLILKSLLYEFALLGLLVGLFSSIFAEVILLLLQGFLFELPYQLHPMLWLQAFLLSQVLLLTTAYWSCYKVTRVSPRRLLA